MSRWGQLIFWLGKLGLLVCVGKATDSGWWVLAAYFGTVLLQVATAEIIEAISRENGQ